MARTGPCRHLPNLSKRRSRLCRTKQLSARLARPCLQLCLHWHQTAGCGSVLPDSIKDKDGESYDGAKIYRLRVPPNAPVEQYWSLTAYDRQTHALIKNVNRASRASNNSEVKKNADGSVDLPGSEAPSRQRVKLDSNRSSSQVRGDVPSLCADEGAAPEELETAGH